MQKQGAVSEVMPCNNAAALVITENDGLTVDGYVQDIWAVVPASLLRLQGLVAHQQELVLRGHDKPQRAVVTCRHVTPTGREHPKQAERAVTTCGNVTQVDSEEPTQSAPGAVTTCRHVIQVDSEEPKQPQRARHDLQASEPSR